MTRLLAALSPEEIDALDRLMADYGDFLPGVARQRARAVGPLLLRAAGLTADIATLREELDGLRHSDRTVRTNLARERRARSEAEAGRARTLKALKAEREEHRRTRQRLRNARAAMRRKAHNVAITDHPATD